MSTSQDIEDIDFRSMLRSVRRSAVLILLAGSAAAVLSAAVFSPKESYVASATLELLPEITTTGHATANRTPVTSEEVTLLRSGTVQSLVTKKLGGAKADAQFFVRSPDGTALLLFSKTSRSEETAIATLKAVLAIYTDLRVPGFRSQLQEVRSPLAAEIDADRDRLANVNAEIAALDSDRSAGSDALISTAAFLETKIAEGTADLRTYDVNLARGPFRVLLEPQAESIASAGRLSKGVTGFFIGLFAAVAAVVLRERFRDLVRNRRDVIRLAPNVDILGEVRKPPARGDGGESFAVDLDRMYSSLEVALDGLVARRIVLAPVSQGDVALIANELCNRSVRSGIDASTSVVATSGDNDSNGHVGTSTSAVFVVCRSVEQHADAAHAAGYADAFLLVAQAGRTTRRELAVALDDAKRTTTARKFVVLQNVERGDYRVAPPTQSC